MADKDRAVYRIVIAGSQEAIFRELTATDRPLPAVFNSRMHTTGMRRGGRMQMRTVSRGHTKTRLMYAMFGMLEFVLPKKTKTENWPLKEEK